MNMPECSAFPVTEQTQLLGQINAIRASNLTPEVHKWDDARTTDEISFEQFLRSVTQQYIKTDAIAQQVRSADRLLQVIGQKCPDFRNANDDLQTVYICIENRIRYLPQILCCACRSMHPISQNGDNDLIAGIPRNF
jgi:hypothetical protein